MHVRFGATRGSIPIPGRHTLRFGGNTTCIEVLTAAGTLPIIDCGSGLHGLGQALAYAGKLRASHSLVSFSRLKTNETSTLPKGSGNRCSNALAGRMQYVVYSANGYQRSTP
jgi:hypothetical protein